LKVLLISQFLSATRGGGESIFSDIANGISEKGHKVFVITNRIEKEDYTKFHNNVKLIFISSLPYVAGYAPSLGEDFGFIFKAIKKGFSLIRKEKIQLIHSNNFSPSFAGSILSSLTKVPHIICIHDVFSYCEKDYWKKSSKQPKVSKINAILGPIFENMIIKLSHNLIHTVSDASRDDLIKLGAKKPIRVIHNAIKNKTISDFKVNPYQFVYVGRLIFYKNIKTVIHAIAIIKQSIPEIQFLVIGDGPYKSNLRNLVKHLHLEDNVKFEGFVSQTKKDELISSSLATVFPSTCEGFGLVMLESFLFNKPVLVSDVRPMNEIVSHEKDGVVIPAYDEKKWAESMIRLIKNPETTKQMGKEGKKKLQTNFNFDSMLDKVELMYQEAISKNKTDL